MAAIFNSAILDSAILVFPLKITHICTDWIPPISTKKIITLSSLPTIGTKKNLHSLILTQLDDGSHLEFCHHEFCYLGFSHLEFLPLKLTHTCQDWFYSTLHKKNFTHINPSLPFGKKNFTHWFWLNFMMAAVLNSAMLDSDTAILDVDTLISSLRFTQKHSHSTLTLTQTNSIWLKLNHSHSTWWWQPSWIQPFCTNKLHSLILTQLDDDSHLEFFHFGFRHCHFGFQTPCYLLSYLLKNTLPPILILTETNSIWLKTQLLWL